MQKIFRLTLLALSAAEVLILHWVLLAARGTGLSPGQALLWGAALAAANAALLPAGRRRIRATGPALLWSRGWMLGSVAALWSGLLLAGGLLLLTAVLLLAGVFVEVSDSASRAGVTLVGGATLLLGFGSIGWGYLVGQRRVAVEPVRLPLRGLPAPLASLRIAHITDLHIGPLLRAPQLRRFVDRINHLEPDLVVVTGDIFDFDPFYIEEGCAELARLAPRCGTFAILGNHDVYAGVEAVARGIRERTPIRLLRDEWVRVEFDGAALCVVGLEDPGVGWTERDSSSDALERMAGELPDGLPRLLLAHRPAYFRQAARLGFPVMLAGHTHGGQLSPPFAPHHNASRLIAHWTRGRFEHGGSTLYVNRGLGVAGLPVRLNCPREIALIQLVEPSAQG